MSILKWLDKNFEYVVLGFLLMVLSSLSIMNVILRYVFHSGLSWSEEVCRYCFVFSAFFSAPCWIRYNKGICVDTLVILLPKRVQSVLKYITDIIMIVFFYLLCMGAIIVVKDAAKVNQLSPALRLPMVYLYGVMAFTFMLSIVRYIQVIFLRITENHKKQREGGCDN